MQDACDGACVELPLTGDQVWKQTVNGACNRLLRPFGGFRCATPILHRDDKVLGLNVGVTIKATMSDWRITSAGLKTATISIKCSRDFRLRIRNNRPCSKSPLLP